MNQSELEANTCSRRQRGKTKSVAMQNQSNREITSTLGWKLLQVNVVICSVCFCFSYMIFFFPYIQPLERRCSLTKGVSYLFLTFSYIATLLSGTFLSARIRLSLQNKSFWSQVTVSPTNLKAQHTMQRFAELNCTVCPPLHSIRATLRATNTKVESDSLPEALNFRNVALSALCNVVLFPHVNACMLMFYVPANWGWFFPGSRPGCCGTEKSNMHR